jgi:hypothetical protein
MATRTGVYPSQAIIIIMTIPAYTVLEIPEDYTEYNLDIVYIKGASEYLSMSPLSKPNMQLKTITLVLDKLQRCQPVSRSLWSLRIYSAFCRYEFSTCTFHSLLYGLFLKWSKVLLLGNPLLTRETNEGVTTIRRAFMKSFK